MRLALDMLCACNPWHLDSDDDEEQEQEEEELEQTERLELLPPDFDPDTELVRRFNTRRRLLCQQESDAVGESSTVSASQQFLGGEMSELMVEKARQTLQRVAEDASEVRGRLSHAMVQYEAAIHSTTNLERRAEIIAEYQHRKYELGVDSREERSLAEKYTKTARSPVVALEERVSAYQIALAHTNGAEENEALKAEYRRFCSAHTPKTL
jgi:hypothetical protein